MEYEITPCRNCTINKGYGGEYRCSICELSKLRQENERLNKKLKKQKEITDRKRFSYGKEKL